MEWERLDLLKKIRDTKGIFHAKMGTVMDRNVMDPTEAEEVKKNWQEYTEELYKKGLNDPANYNGVVIHLEPDFLECEVKWALGSITMHKANGGVWILAELLQILKDDGLKVLHSIYQQIWKTQQWLHRTGKGQFSFQSPKRTKSKTVQTTTQLFSFHTVAR